MHILVLQTGLKITSSGLSADLLKTSTELIRFSRVDHTALGKHAGMGNRTIEILLKEIDVEADRGVEAFDSRMQALFEPVTPGGGASARHSTCHRPASTQISSACQAGERETDGNITSSCTFSTTIEASSSSCLSAPTNRSRRLNN